MASIIKLQYTQNTVLHSWVYTSTRTRKFITHFMNIQYTNCMHAFCIHRYLQFRPTCSSVGCNGCELHSLQATRPLTAISLSVSELLETRLRKGGRGQSSRPVSTSARGCRDGVQITASLSTLMATVFASSCCEKNFEYKTTT